MSWWTYIQGVVTVSPLGRTQSEKRYILETVLDHLPLVTGSERDMNIHIVQKSGYDMSSSHTEFGEWGGYRDWKTLSTETQSQYILVLEGSFRDRMFEQTYKEFQKWICRLAKRVSVEDVLVEIQAYEKSVIIRNTDDVYGKMFEYPSWSCGNDTGEPTWCEYLMWDRAKGCDFPMMLAYKYFADEENDKEVERRLEYAKR